MPRNYKTGPARSRRRADPAFNIKTAEQVFPLLISMSDGGGGDVTANISVVSPADGQSFPTNRLVVTGRPTRAFFIDSTGAKFTAAITPISIGSGSLIASATGLAPGDVWFVMPSRDQAIRGKFGEWLASSVAEVTLV